MLFKIIHKSSLTVTFSLKLGTPKSSAPFLFKVTKHVRIFCVIPTTLVSIVIVIWRYCTHNVNIVAARNVMEFFFFPFLQISLIPLFSLFCNFVPFFHISAWLFLIIPPIPSKFLPILCNDNVSSIENKMSYIMLKPCAR